MVLAEVVMKEFQGHLYETCEDWHPVTVKNSGDFVKDHIFRGSWLSQHCPEASIDYDAWCHPEDDLRDPNHRSVYFFRDERVALLFALTWSS
jgi:hypothetical protein